MYSKTSVQTTPALQTLISLPSDSLRADMAAFLVDYIFSDDPELNGPTFTFIEKLCFVDEIFISQHFPPRCDIFPTLLLRNIMFYMCLITLITEPMSLILVFSHSLTLYPTQSHTLPLVLLSS